MISAGLAVEGHAHGLGLPGPHNPYMTYTEPWRGAPAAPQPKQAEFLRPAPKPLAPPTRYNGSPSTPSVLNGVRLVSQTSSSTRSNVKYPSPPGSASSGPVNLTQQQIKEETPSIGSSEELSAAAAATYSAAAAAVYNRIYQQGPPSFTGMHYQGSLPGVPGPYSALYPSPYTPLIRSNYVQPPPLSPLETYSPPASASATSPGTFVSPPVTFSSPAQIHPHVKPGQSVLREKRNSFSSSSNSANSASNNSGGNFKVPSGKEGSLKHRILTRPPGESVPIHGVISRKRLPATGSTLSPPTTPTKPTLNTNNNTVPGNFTKGSMIQLATGQLRRVEDMTTEDFVLSADKSPELRLAESTVVRIEENPITGTATITLSYNKNRTQVEFEATLEHPFFVYGQSWASCNPERTLQCYGLKVHRLQVGDILVSLTPREPKEPSISIHSSGSSSSKSSPMITTTATTTAMTARQVSRINVTSSSSSTTMTEHSLRHQLDKTLLPPPAPVAKSTSEPLDVSNSRKRRWSAPEICDEDEQATRRHKE